VPFLAFGASGCAFSRGAWGERRLRARPLAILQRSFRRGCVRDPAFLTRFPIEEKWLAETCESR